MCRRCDVKAVAKTPVCVRNTVLLLAKKQKWQEEKVVDLTSLSEQEKDVLSLGLNFVFTTKINPSQLVAHVIGNVESALYKTNLIQKEQIISRVRSAIDKNLPKATRKNQKEKNLNKKQFEILRSLKEDKQIIVVPADNGGKVVVLDIEYYKNKIHEKLHSDTYQLLKLDASERIYKDLRAQLKSLEEKGVLETQMIQKFLKHKHLPIVKGQVKVHKQG
ncbi:unnamed protein product [Didymodactylos carnosus]|uniref:Uncharacterized protein n=1 Tax=Didymodactylos carnosus TaxID=1234261 RepID=A0A8S2RMM4_9BILA|nr:unnamed protein product [Didymodactylos carnosus]CAF4173230.1 unnamed protein product [Didymodactylos carnosus]